MLTLFSVQNGFVFVSQTELRCDLWSHLTIVVTASNRLSLAGPGRIGFKAS